MLKKNATSVQVVCLTIGNEIVYHTMSVIYLISGVAGKPVVVLFRIGSRSGRQNKMVWSVKNPVKQKPKLIVEFPYKERPFGK